MRLAVGVPRALGGVRESRLRPSLNPLLERDFGAIPSRGRADSRSVAGFLRVRGVTSINPSMLGLFGVSSGTIASLNATASSVTKSTAKKTDPTPPWATSSRAPQSSALVQRALTGRKLIDESAAQLDVLGASQDYRKLFALYQGLNALYGLAERMDAKNLSALDKSQITRRFDSGLAEVGTYVDGLDLARMDIARGATGSILKAGVGMKRTTAEYVGAVIHTGSSADPVAAFQGNVAFAMQVQKSTTMSDGSVLLVGGPIDISIDLNDMGSTPRTLGNVVDFVNGKLSAAGVATRLATERTPGAANTKVIGGKTITLSPSPDAYALKVKGSTGEALTFSAPDTADAVYLTQQANYGAAAHNQLLKFQSDEVASGAPDPATARIGDTNWVDGRVFQAELGKAVRTTRASATGPDGSVYVLADVDATVAGQVIKGRQDVALLKYDPAGRLLFARTLGAAETASGYALAVSGDGQVAVAGSVSGALDRGDDGLDPKKTDSFVTVFNADGDEAWTQRRGAREEDEALAVSFGADGSVYVAGRARSAVIGGEALGGYDSYIQGFGPPTVSSPSGVPLFGTQFGTTGEDRAQAMTVDGASLLVAGIEDGHAIVRRYDLQASGAPVLAATRDLGLVQGGGFTGISVQGGRLIVTGATGNAALDAGTITNAHAGGADAFVAALETGLGASASDRLTYFGGTGVDNATAAAFSGGSVWIAGTAPSTRPNPDPSVVSPSGTIRNTEGFLARIDPLTGVVAYERRFNADGNTAAPTSIAVAGGGASVLDRLGLPQGTLDYSDSARVVAGTSARAGDTFFVQGSAGKKKVTIEATDTLATLARKIERASGFAASVSVARDIVTPPKEGAAESTTVYGVLERLQIKPRDARQRIEISAGTAGMDALAGLGIADTIVRTSPAASDTKAERLYGLGLPKTMKLDSPEAIKAALDTLGKSLATVRTAYRNLVAANQPASATITGTAPAYLSAQVANYQAALDRLSG